MSGCTPLLKSLAPTCLAFKKAGGVKKDVYVGSIHDIDTTSLDVVTGEIDSLVLLTGKKLHKFSGYKFRNTSSASLQVSDNGPRLRAQTVSLRLFHTTQDELSAINELLDATEMFVIIQTNAGKFSMYGWNPAAPETSNGLDVTQAESSNGVKMEDDTSMGVTISGVEQTLPYYLLIGADAAATITALDGMSSTAAVSA